MTALRRLLLFLGAVHLAQIIAAAWLMKNWRGVVAALAQAVVDEQQRRRFVPTRDDWRSLGADFPDDE